MPISLTCKNLSSDSESLVFAGGELRHGGGYLKGNPRLKRAPSFRGRVFLLLAGLFRMPRIRGKKVHATQGRSIKFASGPDRVDAFDPKFSVI